MTKKSLKNKINSVDVGCKFGIHPSVIPLRELCHHYLVDADKSEIDYLTTYYEASDNIDASWHFFGDCLTSAPMEQNSSIA